MNPNIPDIGQMAPDFAEHDFQGLRGGLETLFQVYFCLYSQKSVQTGDEALSKEIGKFYYLSESGFATGKT